MLGRPSGRLAPASPRSQPWGSRPPHVTGLLAANAPRSEQVADARAQTSFESRAHTMLSILPRGSSRVWLDTRQESRADEHQLVDAQVDLHHPGLRVEGERGRIGVARVRPFPAVTGGPEQARVLWRSRIRVPSPGTERRTAGS